VSCTVAGVIAKGRAGRLVGIVVAVALAACALGSTSSASAASCPSFRVLHNDRIGAASFPAGSYAMTANTDAGVSCAAASKLLTRFLSDYDGVLPRPWRVVAEGSGKASFKKAQSSASASAAAVAVAVAATTPSGRSARAATR
jgi:hypothetical protein